MMPQSVYLPVGVTLICAATAMATLAVVYVALRFFEKRYFSGLRKYYESKVYHLERDQARLLIATEDLLPQAPWHVRRIWLSNHPVIASELADRKKARRSPEERFAERVAEAERRKKIYDHERMSA